MAEGIKVEDAYFFDTYALVEVVKGNPEYARFRHAKVIVTVFNLAEIHYKLLRDFDRKTADEVLGLYAERAIGVDAAMIRAASQFRLEHRRKDMSLADAVGYTAARRCGVRFLTGDRQFRGISNVEFVR